MASFDLASITAFKFGAQGVLEANTNSVAIDTQGFEGVAVLIQSGAGTLSEANNFSVSFVESDDTNISNASNVKRFTNAVVTEANSVVWASVVPEKRYVFAQLTRGGSANASISVTGVLGFPANAPTQ